jgi:aspartyl/glutamyl-tRNA(Asn/Gln) amidotransferase C subunit
MIDKEKLRKLEKLAQLSIPLDMEDAILKLVNNDIETVKYVYSIDTEGLENLINPYEIYLETYPDVVSDGDKQKELMNCAKHSMYNYFVVPKILDN